MKIDNALYNFTESDISFAGLTKISSITPRRLTRKSLDLLRFAINNKDDYDPACGKNVFDELKIHDAGNLKSLNGLIKNLSKQRLFLIGCDHSVTADVFCALRNKFEDLHLIVFDAHLDVRSIGEPNACFLRRVIEEGSNVHLVGQRVYSKEEHDYIKGRGLRIEDDVKIKKKNVYISFDIDVVDDVFVPTCSTPEPFGKDLQHYSKLLSKIIENNNVIGIDFVEFAGKEFDITYSNIAGVIMTLLKKFLNN